MKLVLALSVLALTTVSAAATTSNSYMLSSITNGCAAKVSTSGYVPVTSFAISGSNPVTGSGSTGAGKLSLGDLVISKPFDDCSGTLATAFLQGLSIPSLSIVGVPNYSTQPSQKTSNYTITVTGAVIDNYSISHGDEAPTETLQLHFQKVCIATTPADGSKASNACYDTSMNRVITN